MSTDEIIKIISDEFENHLTEIDNWNDAILNLDKQLFLNGVQQALDLATVSKSVCTCLISDGEYYDPVGDIMRCNSCEKQTDY